MARARPKTPDDPADGRRRRAHQIRDGERRQPIVGVRVGVKNGGCAGMTYTMEYAEKSSPPTRWSRTRACGC